MAEEIDILLNHLDKQWDQAQQSEDQRATLTRYILLLVIAIQGFIVQRSFDSTSLVLAIIIVLLGLYGVLISAKYYERFRLHICRVGRIMERLEQLYPGANMAELENMAEEHHKPRHPIMRKIHLNTLWRVLHIGIIILGIINIIIIFANKPITSAQPQVLTQKKKLLI